MLSEPTFSLRDPGHRLLPTNHSRHAPGLINLAGHPSRRQNLLYRHLAYNQQYAVAPYVLEGAQVTAAHADDDEPPERDPVEQDRRDILRSRHAEVGGGHDDDQPVGPQYPPVRHHRGDEERRRRQGGAGQALWWCDDPGSAVS